MRLRLCVARASGVLCVWNKQIRTGGLFWPLANAFSLFAIGHYYYYYFFSLALMSFTPPILLLELSHFEKFALTKNKKEKEKEFDL